MERHYGFNQLPNRAKSADGSHVLGWYVSSHREDRYDDDTFYVISLFEVESEQEVGSIGKGWHIRNDTGEIRGKEIVSVKFHADSSDTVVITFADQSEEIAKIEKDRDILSKPTQPGDTPGWIEFKARTLKLLKEERELGIKRVQERKAKEGRRE